MFYGYYFLVIAPLPFKDVKLEMKLKIVRKSLMYDSDSSLQQRAASSKSTEGKRMTFLRPIFRSCSKSF